MGGVLTRVASSCIALALLVSCLVAFAAGGHATAARPSAPVDEVSPAAPSLASARTVVSLTFDDGNANQLNAVPILAEHGMAATFFIPSGFIGGSGYLTRDDLDALRSAGHEIGGHTVNHFDLATIPVDEARRQICTDRTTLMSWGFPVSSFAYPHGSSSPDVENAVRECGYSSARELGDLRTRFGCTPCNPAETVPPVNAHSTDAPQQVESVWTLDDLKAVVVDAEATGGWTQVTFHDVCPERCSDINVTPTMFADFLAWLEPRAETHDTVVVTVDDVIGGDVAPAFDAPAVPAAEPGQNALQNAGLEELAADGTPVCWTRSTWGQSRVDASTVADAHSGAAANRLRVVAHEFGEARLLPRFDLGACAPTVSPGTEYSLRTWYTSTTATQFAVFLRTESGAWRYWTASPWFEASTTYAHAVWEPPPIPEGSTGISFGLSLFSDGTLTVDDAALYPAADAPAAIIVPVTPPKVAPPGPVILAPGPDECLICPSSSWAIA